MFAFHASQPPRHLLDPFAIVHNNGVNTDPIHTDPNKDPHDPPLHGQPPRTIPSQDITNWRTIYTHTPILTPQEVFSYLFRVKTLRIQWSLSLSEPAPPAPNNDGWVHRDTSISGNFVIPAGYHTLDGNPGEFPVNPSVNDTQYDAGDGFTQASIEHLTKNPTHNYLRGLPPQYTGHHWLESDLDALDNYIAGDVATYPALTAAQFHHLHFRYWAEHDQGFEDNSGIEYARIYPNQKNNVRLGLEIELGIADPYTTGFVGFLPDELTGRLLVIPDHGLPTDSPTLHKTTGTASIFGQSIPLALIHEENTAAQNAPASSSVSLTITAESWHPLP